MGHVGDQIRLHLLALNFFIHSHLKAALNLLNLRLKRFKHTEIFRNRHI